uniref:Ig-like domain-containing protein n=1 Tax=Seriola dumerili TaxID=41447 RepID=A0A3B4VAP5_SERDU
MWKRAKNSGPTVRQTVIRRISKTTGVMITQYVVNLPEGKTTPDFQCIPAPVTIQEGKLAVFKAVVKGDPKPEVSWRRAKGHTFDKDKFQSKYDESTGEHILEIRRVCADDTDTFKCYAVNEYGKAVCTTTLTVHDGKKKPELNVPFSASTNPSDFRKLLRKSKVERADGETDERFWEAMLKADRKDYERICSEFGVDLHLILKKLDEKKKERMQNKCKSEYELFILSVTPLYTWQDGVIPYHEDTTEKHSFGRMKDFSIKGQIQKDTELNQMDVERVHLLHSGLNETDDEEIKAQEREDALFECVLTHPLPRITWMGKGSTLEDGEKYSITVSDHKLIHRLLIRNCKQLDKGIYSAVAGITSCSAWLVVEDEGDPTSAGKKKPQKFAVNVPNGKDCDLRCAPTFIVPLKLHTAPKGYECYMSCAVKGNPKPRITWYRNHISLNTNTNYYISNTFGVCSMLILHVGPKDMGDYTITAENALGRAECSTVLSVRGEKQIHLHFKDG